MGQLFLDKPHVKRIPGCSAEGIFLRQGENSRAKSEYLKRRSTVATTQSRTGKVSMNTDFRYEKGKRRQKLKKKCNYRKLTLRIIRSSVTRRGSGPSPLLWRTLASRSRSTLSAPDAVASTSRKIMALSIMPPITVA